MKLLLLACAKPLGSLVGIAGFGFVSSVAPPVAPPGLAEPPALLPPLDLPAAPRPPAAKAPGKKKYPIGVAIPGKPGFCTNPFTGNEVDVRGIPPSTLVRDPIDPNPDHKFRVP